MIRSEQISDFTGFAVRRWPSTEFVTDDPNAGELLSLHDSPEDAAGTAWRLRSIGGVFSFGVIRLVAGIRHPLRTGRDFRPVAQTYIDLENERNRRRPAIPPRFLPTGAAA